MRTRPTDCLRWRDVGRGKMRVCPDTRSSFSINKGQDFTLEIIINRKLVTPKFVSSLPFASFLIYFKQCQKLTSGVDVGVLSFIGVGDDTTDELILSLDCRVEELFLAGKLNVFVHNAKLRTIFTIFSYNSAQIKVQHSSTRDSRFRK